MNKEEFRKEAETLKQLSHPKIVKFYGICSNPLLIVVEFMSNGSLLSYLRSPKGQLLNEDNLINIARQIAEGMTYLEVQ